MLMVVWFISKAQAQETMTQKNLVDREIIRGLSKLLIEEESKDLIEEKGKVFLNFALGSGSLNYDLILFDYYKVNSGSSMDYGFLNIELGVPLGEREVLI